MIGQHKEMDRRTDGDRSYFIYNYFKLGFNYDDINLLLASQHDIHISKRQLKRLLNKMGLYRRRKYTDIEVVAHFLETEMRNSGQLHGYRWMHLKCVQQGLVVAKEKVRSLMSILDPNGVDIRSRRRLSRRQYNSKGPNYLWHVDSYDKLKPYGICINGCIDGFSRKIMWLEAASTNSDPRVIAGYYLKTVIEEGGTAKIIRSDMGTENSSLSNMQVFLRNCERQRSFIYGASQHNQRIESWWCILRRENTQFWISFFEDIKTAGNFSGNALDKSLIQFCFLPLIKVGIMHTCTIYEEVCAK